MEPLILLALIGIPIALAVLRGQQATTPPLNGDWSQVPIGISVQESGSATLLDGLRPTDVGIVPYGPHFNAFLPLITQGVLAQAFTAWQTFTNSAGTVISGGQQTLGALDATTAIVGYDPEHWDFTPTTEQDTLVATVGAFAAAVRATGRQFFVIPDALFNTQVGAQLAPLVDIMGIQAGHKQYAGTGGPADPVGWATYMNATYAAIKAANPNVRVWIQFVVGQTTAGTLISDMATALGYLNFTPDIMGIFGDSVSQGQAVALLRPQG